MNRHYINGEYVADQHGLLSVYDLGFTRGLCVCDFFRTYNRIPFHLRDHYERLLFSANELEMKMPVDLEEFKEISRRLIDSLPDSEVSLRTFVTGGRSSHPLLPEDKEGLVITAMPTPFFPKTMFEKGVACCTTHFRRPFPQAKTTFYAHARKAFKEGKGDDLFEALYINENEEILEGLTSNFFAVIKGEVITSSDERVLCGITREAVIKAAEGRIKVTRRPLLMSEVGQIDEAFITATHKEVMPVVQINGKPLGNGSVGPVTREMMDLFHNYTQRDEWPHLKIGSYLFSGLS